ncbi:hypothetical protein [Mycolicibacterium peregrinum]
MSNFRKAMWAVVTPTGGSHMAHVSDETLGDLRRELDRFKSEQYRDHGYAAAHLAGAVEMLLEEAEPSIGDRLAERYRA